MGDLARTLRELYDTEEAGTAFALDGLVDADVLEKWLQLGVLGQTSNQTLFLAKVTAGLLDAEIAALHGEGKTPEEIFNLLYNQEAMDSARALEHWVDARDSWRSAARPTPHARPMVLQSQQRLRVSRRFRPGCWSSSQMWARLPKPYGP